jgi:hypothetical protein
VATVTVQLSTSRARVLPFSASGLRGGEVVLPPLLQLSVRGLVVLADGSLFVNLVEEVPAAMWQAVAGTGNQFLYGEPLSRVAEPLQVELCGANCAKSAEATVWCGNCACFFCEACNTQFHSFGANARHSRVPRRKRVNLNCSVAEHESESLRYFCLVDQTPVCRDCVTLGEHAHHKFESLKDAMNKIRVSIEADARRIFARVQRLLFAGLEVKQTMNNITSERQAKQLLREPETILMSVDFNDEQEHAAEHNIGSTVSHPNTNSITTSL